jgi:Holliday junction DNA helicase RuvA
MISSLTGTLTAKAPTEVVLSIGGIGFTVHVPISTYEALGPAGTTVTLLTFLHVREDALQLFGFASDPERVMFKALIAITGIGPKMALGILSGISVPDLRSHILTGNTAALTAIPGVGRKTADRLVLELREKVGRSPESTPAGTEPVSNVRVEAALALVSLGYSRQAAEVSIAAAARTLAGGDPPSLEQLIRAALKHVSR